MSASLDIGYQTNRPAIKRSNTTTTTTSTSASVVVPYSFLLQQKKSIRRHSQPLQPLNPQDKHHASVLAGRRSLSSAPKPPLAFRSMPIRASLPASTVDQMTSLVTVYDGERSPKFLKRLPEEDGESDFASNPSTRAHTTPALSNGARIPDQTQPAFHFHRDSVSTTASGSEGSSPTVSLVESNSVSETPATSPDTPASNYSMSSLALRSPATFPIRSSEVRLLPLNEFARPPAPPSKRPKNLKNLAVDTTTASAAPLGLAVSTANIPLQPAETTTSGGPSIAGPRGLASPRKKPNAMGLKIMTPAADTFGFQASEGPIPPTPAFGRPKTLSLRQFQSSPSLPIASPIGGPIGGMRLPNFAPSKLATVGLSSQSTLEETEEERQNFDLPQSREAVPDAYPDGPICIYDPNIFLYLEPTAEVAATFDVIFNVASEVKNPFCTCSNSPCDCNKSDAQAGHGTFSGIDNTFDVIAPAAKCEQGSKPEYIHVPWEHNTDIVPDLHHLVTIIDEKAKQGKRILIHCQCGVSRSASLIVAYGLYSKPGISVQEAYDAAKRRSKWIGPNMNLIMQLQEFRTSLLKVKGSQHSSLKPRSKIFYSSPSLSRLAYEPQSAVPGSGAMPQTAPLDFQWQRPKSSSISLDGSDALAQGPSSAPSGIPWPADNATSRLGIEDHARSLSHSGPLFQQPAVLPPAESIDGKILDASPTPIAVAPPSVPSPLMEASRPPPPIAAAKPPQLSLATHGPVVDSVTASVSLFSPRGEAFAMAPIKPPAVDETFGLTSPRTTDFSVHLPHRFNSIEDTAAARFGLVQPPKNLLSNESATLERAKLKHSLGMSTRSNYDLRAGYIRTESSTPPMPPLPQFRARDDSSLQPSDALLSPRAFEFTKDPFSKAALKDSTNRGVAAVNRDSYVLNTSSTENDPRSPPQQEAHPPIIRNIFDVL